MLTERLTVLRKNKNLTQQDVAAAIGVTRPAYTAYESGSRKPEYETLEKLADFYGVSIDFLLGRSSLPSIEESRDMVIMDGNPEKLTEEEAEYLKISLEVFRTYREKRK